MRVLISFVVTGFTLVAVGCGGPSTDPVTSAQATPAADTTSSDASPTFSAQRPAKTYVDPSVAVNDFLVAVKSGQDEAATSLLTTDAQKEAWTNGLAISSEGFADAQFEVSEVEYLNNNAEAHVMSLWSDVTQQGQRKSFQCVWLLRKESHGWCIYGMATKFLDDAPPVILNFENQNEMQRRQKWAEQQIAKHRNPQTPTPAPAREPIQQATHTTPATSLK